MHEALKGDIRAYWKAHAFGVVEEVLAKYGRLSDCVVVLSPADGAPRLVKRSEAPERLEKRGLNPHVLVLLDDEDSDSLGLVWKDGDLTRATQLVVSRGNDPPKPTSIPPFTRPFKIDEAWLDGASTMIWGLQQQVYEGVQGVGDVASEYMLFWSLFEGSPTLIVREAAKAALGKHEQWKEILGHVYTPCEDVMMLVEITGRGLARFVRPGKE
jgi:hypothetical protein